MKQETIEKQIEAIREEIRKTPYHKGTEHYVGRLRAKIARLKDQLLEKRLSGGGGGDGYAVGKSGNATVVLAGFPSVGKSTLLNALTKANSKTAEYPFTTLSVVPGMMNYHGAKIQILDVPGLISGASAGRGRGKEVLSVMRTADLILFLIDGRKMTQLEKMKTELKKAGIRIDQKKPALIINKKNKGGILIKNPSFLSGFSTETATGIAQEFRLKNAEIIIPADGIDEAKFIDALAGNRVYLPQLVVVNKRDLLTEKTIKKVREEWPDAVLISALKNEELVELKKAIFRKLQLKRIYLKPIKAEPDYQEPLIMRGKVTVGRVRDYLTEEISESKKAYLWGRSAKFARQLVGENHILADEDVISFR